MKWNSWIKAVVCYAVGVSGSCAFAQPEHKVSSSRIEVGSWVFQAAYEPDATGAATTIANIIAFAKPGTAIDDNLVAVWYQKQLDGTWESKSWVTTDQAAAVKSLKQDLNIQDSEDDKWATTGVSTTATPPPSKSYSGGLLTDDPLAAFVLDSPDPEAIVTLLAYSGYKAAVVPSDKASECGTDAQLDGVASEIVAMVNNGDDTVLTTSTLANVCAGTPRGPAPTRPAKPATPPAWSPPGTVPTAPAWTPGGVARTACVTAVELSNYSFHRHSRR